MGGQPSKENNFDQLEDSRDAMRHRDENHLAKEGKDKDIGYVPRRGDSVMKQTNPTNSKGKTAVNTNMVKRPSIQCSEN